MQQTNTETNDQSPQPNRGTIIVDKSALVGLCGDMPKRDPKEGNRKYFEVLKFLSAKGFHVLIPDEEADRAVGRIPNIISDSHPKYNHHEIVSFKKTTDINPTKKRIAKFLLHVKSKDYENIEIVPDSTVASLLENHVDSGDSVTVISDDRSTREDIQKKFLNNDKVSAIGVTKLIYAIADKKNIRSILWIPEKMSAKDINEDRLATLQEAGVYDKDPLKVKMSDENDLKNQRTVNSNPFSYNALQALEDYLAAEQREAIIKGSRQRGVKIEKQKSGEQVTAFPR